MEKNGRKELISIVIPVYKVELYLEKCIESIINQTYKNLEIIIVDDGSPDNCPQICDEYSKKDKRIKVIHKENGGLSDARNAGIDIATGKYIAFVDSDDYVSDDYVEYMYRLIKKYKTQIATCETEVVNAEKNKLIKPSKFEENIEVFSKRDLFYNILFAKKVDVSAYSKLYETALFKDIRYPKGVVYEDTATTYKLIEKCNKIVTGNKKCYYYCLRYGSISKMDGFNPNEYDYIKNTNEMLEYLQKNYPDLQEGIDRFDLYANFRILRLLLFTKPRNKEMEQKVFKKIKEKRMKVLKYKDTPRRDKIAIILSFFGIPAIKISWKIYRKVTNRIN